MALIVCRECNHEVSDKAAHCPQCGAAIVLSVRGKRRIKRVLYGVLIALLVVWAGVTALWLTGRISSPSRVAEASWTHDASRAAARASATAASESTRSTHSVYQTSVEQLYQDYNANAVAAQNKIGDSRIRVTGNVAEINQDATGHPIVTLWTGGDAKADMILNDDQRSAVAQLAKGDAVEIQCDHMRRVASAPQGSDCSLVLVDAGSKQVYLAVFLANGSGTAPAYIVGPMSQSTCMTRSDSISAQLNANPGSDHVASRNCASTALESIALQGCHLSTTMSAVPDLPSAHLWKYDCGVPTVAAARKPAPTRKVARRRTGQASAIIVEEDNESVAAADTDTAPSAAPASSSAVPAVLAATVSQSAPATAAAAAPESLATRVVGAAPSAASNTVASVGSPGLVSSPAGAAPVVTAATAGSAGNASANVPASIPLVTAPSSAAAGTAPANAPAPVAPSPTSPPSAVMDELVTVRATDPGAADHIVSYCNTATAQATDRAAVAAGCRRAEAGAWTRLVLNNEYPTLDDATRQKCNQPPFPDSYVGKESCAKYQLHMY